MEPQQSTDETTTPTSLQPTRGVWWAMVVASLAMSLALGVWVWTREAPKKASVLPNSTTRSFVQMKKLAIRLSRDGEAKWFATRGLVAERKPPKGHMYYALQHKAAKHGVVEVHANRGATLAALEWALGRLAPYAKRKRVALVVAPNESLQPPKEPIVSVAPTGTRWPRFLAWLRRLYTPKPLPIPTHRVLMFGVEPNTWKKRYPHPSKWNRWTGPKPVRHRSQVLRVVLWMQRGGNVSLSYGDDWWFSPGCRGRMFPLVWELSKKPSTTCPSTDGKVAFGCIWRCLQSVPRFYRLQSSKYYIYVPPGKRKSMTIQSIASLMDELREHDKRRTKRAWVRPTLLLGKEYKPRLLYFYRRYIPVSSRERECLAHHRENYSGLYIMGCRCTKEQYERMNADSKYQERRCRRIVRRVHKRHPCLKDKMKCEVKGLMRRF